MLLPYPGLIMKCGKFADKWCASACKKSCQHSWYINRKSEGTCKHL